MPNDSEKPFILVTDDSRLVRAAIVKVLGRHFNTIEADNGTAALRALRQNSRIEVLITDIQMPEMDGYSLICKLRASEDPGLREIPIIAITGADDEITRERAYACGANDFILKPFDAAKLLECVSSYVKEQQGASEMASNVTPISAAKPTAKVEQVMVADTHGSIDQALHHLDSGLNMLRGLKTASIAPHALNLVIKFLPLLKYCNLRFNLGMDKEIAVFQERLIGAREKAAAPAAARKA